MKLRRTLIVILAGVMAGCSGGPADCDPGTALLELERAFGVQFPTNAYRVKAASGDYRGLLDGNSTNRESIVRLELGSAAFAAWRNSVTNSLKEEYRFSPIVDPRFEKKFLWWDLNRFPSDRFTHSFYEVNNGGNDYRKLSIYFLDLGGTNIMYISAFLLKR